MSKQTKTKARKPAKSKTLGNIIWFEIPAENPARAKKFYASLLGWKIKPFPSMPDYSHIDTGGPDASPDGGLMKRKFPEHKGITNYVHVGSVDKSAAKVEKLGGKICMTKTAVPQMGYFVVCQDTEENTFALWEMNANAS